MIVVVVCSAAVALALIMTGAWAVQLRTGQSGWIDTIWSFAVGVVGAAAALAPIAGQESERFVMLGIVGLALAGFVLLHDKAVAASMLFSPAEYANFVSLSVWSVAALIVFAALRYSSALAHSAQPPKP
jgi:hypothetical protein